MEEHRAAAVQRDLGKGSGEITRKRASELFSEGDRKRIADAVQKAEGSTSAEIVPVVATPSGRYDRAEDLFGLVTAMALLAVGWLTCPRMHPEAGWEGGLSAGGLFPVLLTILTGFIAGAAMASRFTGLRLLFLSSREMEEEVHRAARAAFMSSKVRRTAGGTGVHLYVSLFEHRVVVLPDDTIADRNPVDWSGPCATIVEGMKAGRPAEGLEQAILQCGELLSVDFPRADGDEDELSNELVLLD